MGTKVVLNMVSNTYRKDSFADGHYKNLRKKVSTIHLLNWVEEAIAAYFIKPIICNGCLLKTALQM